MEQGTFDLDAEASPASAKLCECGCGRPTPIASWTNAKRNWIAGQPTPFVRGHHAGQRGRKPRLFVSAGRRIGRGTVIDPDVRIPNLSRATPYRGARLICDCGNEYVTRIDNLIGKGAVGSRRTESCGCLQRDRVPRKPSGFSARTSVLCGYRGGARERGLVWELTDEDFDRLTSQDCFYCGCPPSTVRKSKGRHVKGEFTYNGIDRVDSRLGYIPTNVITACETCNHAKRDMPYADFMAWIARLTEYHWFHPDVMSSRLLKGGA